MCRLSTSKLKALEPGRPTNVRFLAASEGQPSAHSSGEPLMRCREDTASRDVGYRQFLAQANLTALLTAVAASPLDVLVR